jgi:hypothetical protein
VLSECSASRISLSEHWSAIRAGSNDVIRRALLGSPDSLCSQQSGVVIVNVCIKLGCESICSEPAMNTEKGLLFMRVGYAISSTSLFFSCIKGPFSWSSTHVQNERNQTINQSLAKNEQIRTTISRPQLRCRLHVVVSIPPKHTHTV